jgi:hypothetical protein
VWRALRQRLGTGGSSSLERASTVSSAIQAGPLGGAMPHSQRCSCCSA